MKMCMKELGMHNYYAEIELEIQNSTKVHLSQLLGKPLSSKIKVPQFLWCQYVFVYVCTLATAYTVRRSSAENLS